MIEQNVNDEGTTRKKQQVRIIRSCARYPTTNENSSDEATRIRTGKVATEGENIQRFMGLDWSRSACCIDKHQRAISAQLAPLMDLARRGNSNRKIRIAVAVVVKICLLKKDRTSVGWFRLQTYLPSWSCPWCRNSWMDRKEANNRGSKRDPKRRRLFYLPQQGEIMIFDGRRTNDRGVKKDTHDAAPYKLYDTSARRIHRDGFVSRRRRREGEKIKKQPRELASFLRQDRHKVYERICTAPVT